MRNQIRSQPLEKGLRCSTLVLIGGSLVLSLAIPGTGLGKSCNNRVYVSDSYNDTVSVIDSKTNQVVAQIPVGTAPINPTITPDGRYVYVSNSQGNSISVIDVATNTVVDEIDPGGPEPSGLAFTPNGKRLAVSLLGDLVSDPGKVNVLDVETGEIVHSIDVGAQPERMGISPNGERVYVNNLGDDTMSVVDIEVGEVVDTIQLGDLPFNVLVSPSGDRVYVGVLFSNYIAVIDTDTNAVIEEISTPTPNGMSFSRDYQSLYVTNVFANTISEISLAEGAVVRTAPAGIVPGFIRVTVDGKRAYFARPYGSAVSVVETATFDEVTAIPTGSPTSLAVCHSP